ncbi:hypothetical protein [Halomonas daqiaonensis]|uniref:Uncharacterized protein n=1 Tax=Halomonas daqiaonensis TaxID=650850 RepID=A0A1H7RZV4_9GAMM|nr:hypothetical protein [Halomonas daqiaonensis]SEL65773.1 hypothetical protein SAMN04488129_11392 [Halomonas daqiaonensis]
MDEIEMMPIPDGTWIMVCPCGQSEVRGRGLKPSWQAFEAKMLPGRRYRVCCKACGRCLEDRLIYGSKGSTRLGPS